MLIRLFLFLTLTSACLAQGEKPTVIDIRTLEGQMKYDIEEFSVAPGAKVRLVLHNDDDMHHNLVICKPGKNNEQEVAQEAWKLAGDGFEKHWIPEHPNLLFASKMADPKMSATLEFTAPKEPGVYPYVCTLPGHAMLMNGEMIVGESVVGSLTELTYMLYSGGWQKLPDFTTLKPVGTDHVKGGLIDLNVARKLKGGFGIVFDGQLDVPADGKYTFKLGSDDGSRLMIDETKVVDVDGIHPMQSKDGSIDLKKGHHVLKLEYFEGGGQKELAVSWSGPGFKDELLSAGTKVKQQKSAPAGIPLSPTETEAVIYRNFIEGAGARAIGVGYPGSVNLAFDADQMRIALVWQGAFIDAALHWNGRGQGFQRPLGYNVFSMVEGVPFVALESSDAKWPDTARKKSTQRPDNGYVFKGYRLTETGQFPEFHYFVKGIAVSDFSVPIGSVKSSDSAIERTLTLRGESSEALYFRAARAAEIVQIKDGRFAIDGKIWIRLDSAEGGDAIVRDSEGQKELLIPVRFKDSIARIRQTISWN